MDRTALSQSQLELRRLAIAGAELSAGDARLRRQAGLLGGQGAPVLSRLAERLAALTQATEAAAPAALLSCATLARAVRSTQLPPTPKGGLTPLPPQPHGVRSQRRSGRLFSTLRAALTRSGPGRAAQLEMAPEALFDLRLAPMLPAALDDAGIANGLFASIKAAIASQAGLLDDIEASFSGQASGDARRLQLLRSSPEPARAHAPARRILEGKPKPALRAEAYRALASDPEALPLLIEGARRGPVEARAAALLALPKNDDPEILSLILKCSEKGPLELRRAAFSSLARRQEPEAAQAIAAQVGKEGNEGRSPYPTSLDLLREALPHVTQPALLFQLIAGLQDPTRPTGEGEGLRGPDRAERWRRWHFALALSWCPPTAESLSALCAACEEGWPPSSAFEFVFRHAEQRCIEALLSAAARARRKARSDERREDGLVIAICRLPPARVFELLSEGAGIDKGLLSMMQAWRRRRPALWQGPHGAYYAELEWDPRWLALSLDQERVMYTAALAEPGTPSAPAAARLCVDKLPKLNTERAILALGCLERLGAPELGAQALAAIERHLKVAKKKIYYDHELEQLLNFLGPAQAEGLAKLRPLSKFPKHEEPIDSRLAQLR